MFFSIRDDSFSNKVYPWVHGYGPLTGPMPFIPAHLLEWELAFWKVNPAPPGLKIDNGEPWRRATKWPDVLGATSIMPVSERVVESLISAGYPPDIRTEMPIARIDVKRLREIPAPKYFILQYNQGIKIHDEASQIVRDETGKITFHGGKNPRWVYDLSTWNGADIFGSPMASPGPSDSLLCTEKIIELAKRDRWTNVRFEPVESQ